MSDKFEDIYQKLEGDEVEFLLEFLFQLTIVGREIHVELEGKVQSSLTKQLNEINHRVLNRIRDLKGSESWSTKKYLLGEVARQVSLEPKIRDSVGYAATQAYSKNQRLTSGSNGIGA